VDERKLNDLTKPNEPTPAPVQSEVPVNPAELEKANEKLASLLGKPK
jgi:hypothetical protein